MNWYRGAVAYLGKMQIAYDYDKTNNACQNDSSIHSAISASFAVTVKKISDGSEEREITLKFGSEANFLGQAYLLDFVIPNFHFHLTTTYAILRHNGVEIGKRDYIGDYEA